jgi:tape measure domain-containing protein
MADKQLTYTLSLKDLMSGKMARAVGETKRMDSAMTSIGSKLKNLAIGFGGLALGKSIIDTTAKFQSFNTAINVASGDSIKGATNLKFLNDQVDRLGLDINATYGGYKTFSGALMGTSLAGDKANTVFRQVSEASTVMGLSGEQTEGAFLALGQMMSKGTVSAEELRGQLGERIPGAFQIAARAMGVTTMQLGEMMKAGEVVSEDFLPKFGKELEKMFGGKVKDATNSLQSNLNRMGNEWERLKSIIGTSFLPTIIKVTQALSGVFQLIGKILPLIKVAVMLWGAYYIKMKLLKTECFGFALAQRAMAIGMSKSAIATGFLSRGIRGIGHAIKAVPVIGWIAALVEGIMYLWDTFEGFRTSVYRAFETFINMGTFLSGLFQGLGNMMKGALNGMPETIRLGMEQIKAGALGTKLATEAGVRKRTLAYNAANGLGGNASADAMGGVGSGSGAGGSGSGSLGSGTDISSSKPTSIIINLPNGLIQNFTVATTNMKEGAVATKDELSRRLLELLSDAKLMQLANT